MAALKNIRVLASSLQNLNKCSSTGLLTLRTASSSSKDIPTHTGQASFSADNPCVDIFMVEF